MKGVILVGGEGMRMRPLTYHTPKPLLPIANVAFVERQIKWLSSHGINEIILSLGYLPDTFEEYFHTNPIENVHIEYAIEDNPLGTAGAIKYAIKDVDDDFVVCNGDVLTDLDITELMTMHRQRNSQATIALTYVEDPSAFGVVPTDENNKVIAFVEKPPLETAPSHWINAGIYILSPRFLDLIPENVQVSIERETFPTLLENGSMYALESQAYWLDIGTPTQYLRAHSDYLDSINKYEEQDSLIEVAPGLFSDGEVKIGRDVIIKSRSLVGAGTVIGDNCVLEATSMGRRCILGDDVKLSNSVLHAGVNIEQGCYVDSSIIGEATTIGANSDLSQHCLVKAHENVESNSRLKAERVGMIV
ncbi:MAG: NDP-sugar synthase [Acidimicrobiia bacterium]